MIFRFIDENDDKDGGSIIILSSDDESNDEYDDTISVINNNNEDVERWNDIIDFSFLYDLYNEIVVQKIKYYFCNLYNCKIIN